MAVFIIYFSIAALVVLALLGAVGFFAYRSRDRWLVEGKEVAAGVGAFRQGPTKGLPEVQHRRWLMVPVAVGNILLAVITVFFLAPAGILGALVFLSEHETSIFWGTIGIASLDAFPLGVMLIAASIQLARRSRTVVPVALAAGLWTLLHHGGLIAVGAIHIVFDLPPGEDELVFGAMGIAGVGLLPAIGTVLAGLVAARDARTLPVSETG